MCSLFWMFFFSCLYFTESIDNRIYPEEVCETDSGVLNCTCTSGENLTVSKIVDSSIIALEIHDCGYVTILSTAFWGLNFQYVVFNNLLVLDLKTDSFKAIRGMEFLELSNIVSLKTATNSIEAVDTSKVILLNVTCDNVKPYSFNLDSVSHFLITNSSFGTVETAGFSLLDPRFFFVINSTVENLLTGAVQLNGTGFQVYLHNSSFVLADQESFYFESIEYLTVQSCEFQDVRTNMMFGSVTNFLFLGNIMVNTESFIFPNLKVSYLFWLKENRFINTKPEALDYNFDKVTNVSIENNTFDCNCDTLWLMDSKYELFRASSFCETSTGKISLTRLNYLEIKDQCGKSEKTTTVGSVTNTELRIPTPHESIASESEKVIIKSEKTTTVGSVTNTELRIPTPHESIASKSEKVIVGLITFLILNVLILKL